ncbi:MULTISPECIES: HAMP domain-containing sensor histidine kinase [unclassified Pseudomonas]|uniref:sensor histidine kinase n=1 Tax=unclassified Pseudomonas TaxID=196821 RepID=UPI00244A7E77|nr:MULTISPECIES: HAMP domain-containing sensor histidine kinase [unclassified Pseudomonas]MDG9930666.1 HAMP domain-containing histidine kinase [Pseudomonas sp. GD04042]MDH0481676.1 HAMP domain-containing histidine kinase [Pseudomonas sp. GD04015]MDH0603048.1 HAMP domain-containing histidine kinase [Pseudomonas sp. GD03869]
MEFRQSLSRRIVIAFVLMTALVGGTFAFGIVETVHQVEERLISQELSGDLGRFLKMESISDWRHEPEPGQLFYFSGGQGDFALPPDLQGLSLGFHEVFRGDKAFHGFVQVVDGRRYVLLQDQSGFEDREQLLFAVVQVGFLISLALSGLLGWLLARKVIEPVVRLSRQVRAPEQLLDEAPRLAKDYASDEVGQLAASFDTTLGLLRRALMRERLFTSDVSHELRTPLMVLASSCELLLESSCLDNRGRTQVQRIANACEEMRGLVQTFLTLARARQEDAGGTLRGTLGEVADDLVAQWRPAIEAKGLSFDYQPERTGDQRYNAPLLKSVLGNLLRNALHYTEHGRISLRLDEQGFVVEDSGVGIPAAEREAMFQPFVRGGSARGEGLGLGLSLVQRICENQGWSVELSDAEPRGCRFQVTLMGGHTV